jgi:hypothetical protein
MSKFLIAGAAALLGMGLLIKSQLPELRRYVNIERM